MFYSSRKGMSSSRKQTSFTSRTTLSKHEDGNKSGNETDCASTELLSTSREDLSPSRCSCQSGGSSAAVRNDLRDGGNEHFWSGNLRLEFDNNGGSDDEQLKDELLRIFDRERLGLESYFKQKTENILAGYRRKQYEWEEKIRLERMDYEKTLAEEKIEVQQNYISEMTNLTKQFNQERVELEIHYKKQIEELSKQFEIRKKKMDSTIIRERTELKERLEVEYQAMLKSQRTADEQRYRQQISELEETYKKKLIELEQKLKDSFSEGELSGRRLQSDMEAKFEQEKSVLVVEWRKRVALLEVELGKEKDRANREERKACESHGFLRNEISKKDVEQEKLRQVVEALKLELSHKEKAVKEHEILQQSIFLRGNDALPGKLREDFEKMLAVHREELEKKFCKERKGLENEREAQLVLERETMRQRLSLDLERERVEMKQAIRELEDKIREEVKEEKERMRTAFEIEREQIRGEVMKENNKFLTKEKESRDAEIRREKELLREQVRSEFMQERKDTSLNEKTMLREQVRAEFMIDEQTRDAGKQSGFISQQGREQINKESEANLEGMKSKQGRDHASLQEDERRNHLRYGAGGIEKNRSGQGSEEYEVWLAGQRMEHTKQWVEGQSRFTNDNQGKREDCTGFPCKLENDDNGDCGIQSDGDGHSKYNMDIKGHINGSEEFRETKNDADKGHLKSQDASGCHKGVSLRNKNETHEQFPNELDQGNSHAMNSPRNSEFSVRGLREENEGLKAKVGALQENISLHECFKKEASEEVQRLRNTNKGIKIKLEGLEGEIKDYEGLKKTLRDYEVQSKDYQKQVKDNEEKIKEYEDICAEYERSLQTCRQKIMKFENDRESLTIVQNMSNDDKKAETDPNKKSIKNTDNGGYRMVNSLEIEKSRLETVVNSLDEKVKLLETKIFQLSLSNKQANDEKIKLASDLERVHKQKKGLVNKIHDLQVQLQAMLDKLRKKKRKIVNLRDENTLLKSIHRREISDLQQKLEYSNQIITRLQHESSTESSNISRLQEEISNINKLMMEERMCEQRMLRARSIEEIEKVRDLDRDKVDLQRKINEVKHALDSYSDRLKNKMSFRGMTSSQCSVHTDTSSFRDIRLSKTLQALEASKKASKHQNERLKHEKHELQTLMSRLCKSQDDLRSIDRSGICKESLSSRSSSMSSLSSSCVSLGLCGLQSRTFSSTFSVFH